jgi:hypothetical protein
MHHIQGILLAVVHKLSRGVNLRRIHLEALRLIESTTTRWRDLGGGLLLVAAGPWSLGKLLGLGRGTTTRDGVKEKKRPRVLRVALSPLYRLETRDSDMSG